MFHANAWGFPFTCTLVGVGAVFPGPAPRSASLLDAFVEQEVTITAGVPTIWMGILQTLDAQPDRWDLSRLRSMIVGGAAAPQAMIEGFENGTASTSPMRWGMTEMAPMGTISALSSRELAPARGGAIRVPREAGVTAPPGRDPGAGSRGSRFVGRRHDGRARGARPLDLIVLLRGSGGR